MALVQFRVDDQLKEEASIIFEKLGLDLSTALRMFLKRSVMVNGIPFKMSIDSEDYNSEKALEALKSMQEQSAANGISDMTLEEINQEIKAARKERKK